VSAVAIASRGNTPLPSTGESVISIDTLATLLYRPFGACVNIEDRERAEKIISYTFQNPDLLKEALTHASVADHRLNSNERMEFLGDAVLDLIVCEALYKRFPEYLEGDLTKIKSAVVSRRTCAEVSNETGLIDLLIIGKGISSREEMPSSLAAAVYESIVAAIYLDGGFEVVKQYVLRTMSPKIDSIASNAHQQNFKAVLQQHAQKIMGATPIYELLDEKGPDHSKCFEICVVIESRRFGSAWGPNKKMAEQKAALLALEELGVFNVDEQSADGIAAEDSGEGENEVVR
jgi:ribonuclease III